MNPDPAVMRKRHEFMMQQHALHMHKSRWRAALLVAFLLFVILMSTLVLINPALVGAERVALGAHLQFAIAIYTTALLILIAEILLLIKSRYRALEVSIRMTRLSFELGQIIGRRSRTERQP